jgi:mono/diheme cytochrome c family protein
MTKRGWALLGLVEVVLSISAPGATSAKSIMGTPNPHSQVGRQGTTTNQMTPGLNGKANRRREKKVTNRTTTPMPTNQVAAGAQIFAARCATCHGSAGAGTYNAPRLAAPSGVWFTFHSPTALQNYIQGHMPGDNPGTLSRIQAKDVAAYVWSISKAK